MRSYAEPHGKTRNAGNPNVHVCAWTYRARSWQRCFTINQHVNAMNTLRIFGIAALLSCVFFKFMHWPGASALALLGFIMAGVSTLLTFRMQGFQSLRRLGFRPIMAVLLYGAGLMYMLAYPGGTVVFHTMVVVTIVFLLASDLRIVEIPCG